MAEREYERAIEIQKKDKGLISRSEVDKRLGARDASRANAKSLESALTSAQDDLGYSHLKASATRRPRQIGVISTWSIW